MRLDGEVELGTFELLACDVRQDDAVAPREGELAVRVCEPVVFGQCIHDLMGVVPSLLDGVRNVLGNPLSQDFPGLLVGRANRFQAPVLDLKDEQPAPWMQNNKIGMGVLWPDGHVVPGQIVVVELLLQPLGGASLPLRHAGDAGAQSGDDRCHVLSLGR